MHWISSRKGFIKRKTPSECQRLSRSRLGRLLLNFYVPSYVDDLLLHQESPPAEERFGEFINPETEKEIEVSYSRICDHSSQTESYTWIL